MVKPFFSSEYLTYENSGSCLLSQSYPTLFLPTNLISLMVEINGLSFLDVLVILKRSNQVLSSSCKSFTLFFYTPPNPLPAIDLPISPFVLKH